MTLTPVGDKWLSSEKNISPAEALYQTRLQFIHDKKPVNDWAPFEDETGKACLTPVPDEEPFFCR